ncbi:MAG TPA: cardiolipin synthase ClsB [Rhodocyclaceae bacterium]|nr:cardiolipin synthase ClsB [Rhodocyclaceae bacterium]
MRPEFVPGNRVTLLERGGEFFPSLLRAIAEADVEVRLETYIFADDAIGRAVAGALAAAARRGVLVRILVDGFGARNFPTDFGLQLAAAGAQFQVFRPEVGGLRLRRNRLRRLHRKTAVIDGRIAFVGGINVLADVDEHTGPAPRHDYAVRIEGPLVARLHSAAVHLWRLVRWASLRRRPAFEPVAPNPGAPGGVEAAFVLRDNFRHRRDIEVAYLAALAGARSRILIANAYFLPGRRFRRQLVEAARRGVAVTLLVQGRVEYLLQHFATQALYGALLGEGVRVFEYQRSFLHAKVAVVDGRWATVGSSNIDPFSLLLAREANVVVRDEAFAAALQESLERTISHGAVEIRAEDWRKAAWPVRLARWLAYGLVRLLVGFSGYGGREYRE